MTSHPTVILVPDTPEGAGMSPRQRPPVPMQPTLTVSLARYAATLAALAAAAAKKSRRRVNTLTEASLRNLFKIAVWQHSTTAGLFDLYARRNACVR